MDPRIAQAIETVRLFEDENFTREKLSITEEHVGMFSTLSENMRKTVLDRNIIMRKWNASFAWMELILECKYQKVVDLICRGSKSLERLGLFSDEHISLADL